MCLQNGMIKTSYSTDRIHFCRKIPFFWLLCAVFVFLTACTSPTPAPTVPEVTPSPTPTAAPTRTPQPTWTPTLQPTATPIPPATLRLIWPQQVNALVPVPIQVEFIPPAGTAPAASIRVTIKDPADDVYAVFDAVQRDGFIYSPVEKLQLPLNPLGGYWQVNAQVDTELQVVGERALFFVPDQIYFKSLRETIPGQVRLRIPKTFLDVSNQGTPYAGYGEWQHSSGQIGLWWAPGPTEELLMSNAVTMLEATFPEQDAPAIADVAESTWYGRTTFVCDLVYPEGQSGVAWVVQDQDFWLYVLAIRSHTAGDIPILLQEVAGTFSFAD
ncbi:MAG: hypothetical protein P1S60_03210 [Anaerolineae bacterium]|nr:hypothetical protein [Anaerolineae bacterium]